jgi:hypothetical protein
MGAPTGTSSCFLAAGGRPKRAAPPRERAHRFGGPSLAHKSGASEHDPGAPRQRARVTCPRDSRVSREADFNTVAGPRCLDSTIEAPVCVRARASRSRSSSNRRVRIARSKHRDTSEARGDRAAPRGACQIRNLPLAAVDDPAPRAKSHQLRLTTPRRGGTMPTAYLARRRPTAIGTCTLFFRVLRRRSAAPDRGLDLSSGHRLPRLSEAACRVIDPLQARRAVDASIG